jgi:rRNA maturation endonuclease Nob1
MKECRTCKCSFSITKYEYCPYCGKELDYKYSIYDYGRRLITSKGTGDY